MLNSSTASDLPPLPSYTLTPLPSLLPPIPDKFLTPLLPVVAYWAVSLIFHFIDVNDYFSQYRLHTPAEVRARNHATRWEVFRDVIIQQIIQTAFGIALGMTEPDDLVGREEYDVAVWARRIRIAQKYIPGLLAMVGVDAVSLAQNVGSSSPMLAGALSGGNYNVTQLVDLPNYPQAASTAFAPWELAVAWGVYHVCVPFLQFAIAIVVVDTWQYFLHRGMHMNKWLYTTLHSRHHRLYVPYAYGALYNHPVEGFMLDTLGAGIAFKLAGMTTRQGMLFFTCATIKTVDDHCGYAFPWDPLQHLSENNASYHDVHHQSWGVKTNFSQPFFTFWDRFLETKWTGGDVSARYERARIAAQKKVGQNGNVKDVTGLTVPSQANLDHAANQAAASQAQVLEDPAGGPAVLVEEAEEEQEARKTSTRSLRRKTGSDGLKGLRGAISPSLHGPSTALLGMDGR